MSDDSHTGRVGPRQGSTTRRISGALGSLALLVGTLLLIELVLRLFVSLPSGWPAVAELRSLTRFEERREGALVWKLRFLERYERRERSPESLTRREYEVDPTLGWRPKSDLKHTDRGHTYTTNSLGFRSLVEHAPHDERTTVLVVGDSFTYGIGASDDETWPALLQSLDNRLQVVNMGVAGYGVDQMSLMLERHITRFRPEVVVAAFVTDDLRRSTLDFRDYRKPLFELEGEELVLTNTPIADVPTVAADLERELRLVLPLTRLATFNLVAAAVELFTPKGRRWQRTVDLNERILARMVELTSRQDAAFLLVHLPSGPALIDPDFEDPGEAFFERFTSERGLRGFCPRARLLKRRPEALRAQGGHYSPAAARVVARGVLEEIRGATGR